MNNSGRRQLNPAKLLKSKWTACAPKNQEKHFLVIRIIQPELPEQTIELVEIEAVHSHRTFILPWQELTDPSTWIQGWVS